MKRLLAALAVLALSLAPSAPRADGGMWMPQQMVDLAPRLKKLGFQGNPKAFADLTGMPMGAIVSLGGCSASFVSPDGLIVTNHHCVTGALQYNATPERNTVKEGFLAATRADEVWAGPGSRVFVTVAVREVTKDVTGKVSADLPDLERQLAIEKRTKDLTAACEKEGLRCRVASFFEGLRWFEIAQVELKDVRLVYAPPSSIGNFGGETDNWRWPRHSGDFAFYRAYVGKDGKPAAFDKANVPFKPRHYLQVDTAGASPGDVVVVAGYPGRTARHVTAREMKDTIEWNYPRIVKRYGEMLAILAELSKGSKETEIHVAQRVRGLANSMKNRQGVLEGAKKGKLVEKKSAAEAELQAWIDADSSRKKKYGGVISALEDLQARQEAVRERDATFQELYFNSSLLGSARTLRRLAEERQKPDADREPGYQQRDWERLREAQERLQRTIDLGADRALLRYTLLTAAALPQSQRIEALDAAIGLTAGLSAAEAQAKIDSWLGTLYGTPSKIADQKARLALFDGKPEEVLAAKDPFLDLAAALAPLDKQIRDAQKARAGATSRLGPVYMQAMLEKAGGLVAPDANSTLRVTFGTVKGVSPQDGILYLPQTALQGVVAKVRPGDKEFDAPPALLAAAAKVLAAGKGPFVDAKLGDVPVNFLSDVDTTGGNSGSAVLNAKGKLVGLLFDGTYETVASDLLFDPVNTRSIQVDIRYVLWVASQVSGATRVVEELGVKP
ncbi:MAG TPA: S46 family peptidase [Anaeromyxobacteraceae bacterium]|nr:S46 family peptidase [Anaeromyxobacteraceae bacterium]